MISIISASLCVVAETATSVNLKTLFSRRVINEVEIVDSKQSVLLPVNTFNNPSSLVGITLEELPVYNGLNGNKEMQ